MKSRFVLASAVILNLAVGAALAQYTPGAGGGYVAPGVPVVPAPVAPAPPQQPTYSWQAPPTAQVVAPAAQPPLEQVAPDAVRIVAAPAIPQLSDQQLSDLTASVALYPDPLLAEMLPAATYVQEITYANAWLTQHPGPDEATLASLPVHPSIISLMHYPTVLSMMSDHIDWTQALGVAFQYQPNDVMESVQRWRATAVAYGTLASSPQIDVLRQTDGTIMILPPQNAQVLYVPVYDPTVVFVRPVRPVRNAITFSGGGFALTFVDNDVDWHDHQIHVPVHHDDHGAVVVQDHGRGGPPPEKKVFVHDDAKPVVVYPSKIVTPTPDHKVVVVPAGRGRGGMAPAGSPGPGNDRGPGPVGPPQNPLRRDNPPGTPF